MGLLQLASCSPSGSPGSEFVVVQFLQDGADAVLLDEDLIFRFNRDLDRSSVTSSSVRIFESAHPEEQARGQLRIHRDRLDFRPDLARQPDLSDGGLRPGTSYTVELAGFPRPDGLRSSDARPLASNARFEFQTAGLAGTLFGGESSEGRLGLAVEGGAASGSIEIGPLDPLVLRASTAVDPRSLSRGEFCILPREGDPKQDIVLLLPRLTTNRTGEARIELYPAGKRPGLGDLRALAVGEYYLTRTRDEMRDLSGRHLLFGARRRSLLGLSPPPNRPLVSVSVVAPRTMQESLVFGGAERPWYGEPMGFDATAFWPHGGSGVTIRFPAAAGNGEDGALDPFTGLQGSANVAATDLRIPKDRTVSLGNAHGFVLLRSQGAIEIQGRLERRLEGTWTSSLAEEMERASLGPETSHETLSSWIERARRLNEPWTVLVAGGDLRVTGTIHVDGPLLLIAGGWLRIYGRVDADRVFKSPEGGENIERVREAPLRLDPPRTNPLVHPLRAAILTNTHRPMRGVESWIGAQVHGEAGAGRLSVRFLGLRDRESGSDRFDPVGDIRLLDGCQALRLLLVLEMPAGQGEAWDPPRIDSVDLSWDVPR